MKNYDINEFANRIFGGAMLGIIVGGHAGKTFAWMFIGALVCGAFWATGYIKEQMKK